LRVENLTHRVNGVEVLSHFNLNIFSGEIMGLLSPDSQGKAELVGLICENSPVHYGRLYYMGQLVNSHRSVTVTRNNVAVIDREHRLVDDLTAAENIFVLGKSSGGFIIDRRTLCRQMKLYAGEFSVELDCEKTVRQMSAFERCAVELIRAKAAGARLLVAGDISGLLSANDLPRFQDMLRRYVSDGSSVLYICGRREESFRVCDRVALMEGGRAVSVVDRRGFDKAPALPDFARSDFSPRRAGCGGGALVFDGVTTDNLDGLSFSVGRGECVALLDLSRSALGDVAGLIAGELSPRAGGVSAAGRPPAGKKAGAPAGRRRTVEFIPDNPVKKALFPELSYLENLCYPLGEDKPFIWRSARFLKSIAADYERLAGRDVYETDISRLSAESLYKLVYYRAHLKNPELVVCLQPFSGADTHLRRTILELIEQLLERGIAVLLLLADISDGLAAANRVIILRDGRQLRECGPGEFGRLGGS